MVRSQTGLLTSAAAEPLPGGAGGAAGVVGGGGGTRAHPASRGEVKEPDAADGGQVREGDRRPRGAVTAAAESEAPATQRHAGELP